MSLALLSAGISVRAVAEFLGGTQATVQGILLAHDAR